MLCLCELFALNKFQMFTLTGWYVVPIVWLPITAFLFCRSAAQFSGIYTPVFEPPSVFAATPVAYAQTLTCFFIGNIIWTLLEYTLHRFLFHIDEWLPDHPYFLTLHFLLHGVHHYLPMDKYVQRRLDPSTTDMFRWRLVMPPVLFFALSYPFTQLAHALFGMPIANGIIAGSFAMCMESQSWAYSSADIA
jgi:4-hydroxysphinganine ceramide fatty acyl 2-hydroxylase